MSAEVPSKEEVLQGQLSVEQIKKAIETYTNENTDGYVARDDVTIRCKDERYTNTYYNIHCTTEEFIEGIKNAKISKDDKLACFDQMKGAMESQLLKRFDKVANQLASFQKIDKVKAEISQMGLVNMMGGQSR